MSTPLNVDGERCETVEGDRDQEVVHFVEPKEKEEEAQAVPEVSNKVKEDSVDTCDIPPIQCCAAPGKWPTLEHSLSQRYSDMLEK